jgi:hypothetical protein
LHPKEFVQEILELSGVFPNITIALRICFSLLKSVTSVERTFSDLNQVKNYYRPTMGQDRMNGFATLSINCDLARKLDFHQ